MSPTLTANNDVEAISLAEVDELVADLGPIGNSRFAEEIKALRQEARRNDAERDYEAAAVRAPNLETLLK